MAPRSRFCRQAKGMSRSRRAKSVSGRRGYRPWVQIGTGKTRARKREADGNGATVTILPASEGYVAISPREERQWTAWLSAMGSDRNRKDPRAQAGGGRQWRHGHDSAGKRRVCRDLAARRASVDGVAIGHGF